MFLSARSRCVPSLGLDNGGEPGEAAAALAVRHHLICHQIDVIDGMNVTRIARFSAEDRNE
jgi:hypothetical protein